MIELKNLIYTYNSGKTIHYPDWSLRQGVQALVHGRHGTGKSTLLFLLSGLLKPQYGEINVCDQRISDLSGKQLDKFRGRNIGFMMSDSSFIPEFNLQDNLLLAQRLGNGTENMEKVYMLLHEFGIAGRALDYPARLSQVELKIAAILRAIINRPRLILVDEPVAGLTEKEGNYILRILSHQARNYEATLVITSRYSGIQKIFMSCLKLENV